ncbi:armadillo-type protein [Choanephora cucurbitarum]|nr:armadillo-type protein [Choanephora cucurbitarum]
MSQLINKEVRHVLLEAVKSNEKETATEGWYVCTSLTQHYPSEARSLWASFAPNNLCPLPISSASLKYMESYANLIQDECNESDQQWWKEMIVNYMQQAASNESSVVRAAACDCFASLTKTVFEKLDFACQRLAITLLFSLSSDSDVHVKAAACRALGVFVSFESLREDPLFISDTIKAILSQKEDKSVLVRVRTSWSIANLCDALVLESAKTEFNLREYMSTTDWIDILNMTIAALDNEKCKSNAVRAIGSLLRLTPKEYYDNMRIMALVKHAVLGVMKHIETGSLKTRWNACYAVSNMLQNPHFPIGFVEQEGGLYSWTHSLYNALIHALVDCKNFKVRINACLALTAAKREAQYGDKLPVIAKSILDAYDNCQTNTAHKEMKYKQQLEQQVS